MKRRIFVLSIIFAALVAAGIFAWQKGYLKIPADTATPGLNISTPKVLYPDAELNKRHPDAPIKYSVDTSYATLKQADGSMCIFETNGALHTYKFCGPANDPLKTLIWEKNVQDLWTKAPGVVTPDSRGSFDTWGIWLKNIHKIDNNGHLLGFVHVETKRMTSDHKASGLPAYSMIGLGYSSDNGDHWTYLGDIIRSQRDPVDEMIGGAPLLLVGDYFYVYYNEHLNGTTGAKTLSVARAKISDVIQAATPAQGQGTVTPWKKYNNGTWTEDGFTGTGSNIIDAAKVGGYGSNGDAVYSSALNKYLWTIGFWDNIAKVGTSWLYSSTDGVNWGSPQILKQAQGKMFPYSTFVSTSPDASDDNNRVGANFSILIDSKNWGPEQSDARKIDDLYISDVTVATDGSQQRVSGTSSQSATSLQKTVDKNIAVPTLTSITIGFDTIIFPIQGQLSVTSGFELMLNGKSFANAAIALMIGDKAFPGMADKYGDWKIVINSGELATGDYIVKAQAQDTARNKGSEIVDLFPLKVTEKPAEAVTNSSTPIKPETLWSKLIHKYRWYSLPGLIIILTGLGTGAYFLIRKIRAIRKMKVWI